MCLSDDAAKEEGMMKRSRWLWALVLILLTSGASARQVPVILDSDVGNDCEDAAAIGVLHALADRGEARILAMIYPMHDPWGAAAMSAINTYYGRPGIPIGTYRGSYAYKQAIQVDYGKALATEFPNRLGSGANADDAIALYRKTLAAAPDRSVTIIAIGPLQTLRELLDSPPDRYSNLPGRELVARKVALLSVMGGEFPVSPHPEWNFLMAPEAASMVAEQWPTPIVYSGFEIGAALIVGKRLLTETPASNPVRRAYEMGCRDGRMAWDETSVIYGVRGLRDYWFSEPGGTVAVDAKDGSSRWEPLPDRKRTYLKPRKPIAEMTALIGDLEVEAPKGSHYSGIRAGVPRGHIP